MIPLFVLQSGSFGFSASSIALLSASSGPFNKRSAISAKSLWAFSFCLLTNSFPNSGSEKAACLSWSHKSFCSLVKHILVSTGKSICGACNSLWIPCLCSGVKIFPIVWKYCEAAFESPKISEN